MDAPIIKSPFRDQASLKKDIEKFINRFKSTVQNQASRISDYFEMCCFNYVVKFYENTGYEISIQNLQSGKYRYKCSTAGIQSNFSHFRVTKKEGTKKYSFEIHHNLAVQSGHDNDIFTTPDISVIKLGKVQTTVGHYDSNVRFSHVLNQDLITFFEVKHYNPFPELIFNFIGVVNELRPQIIKNCGKPLKPTHLAPSIMISGKPNKHTCTIKTSLERRYCINIIYDVFYTGASTFSKKRITELRNTGKLPLKSP